MAYSKAQNSEATKQTSKGTTADVCTTYIQLKGEQPTSVRGPCCRRQQAAVPRPPAKASKCRSKRFAENRCSHLPPNRTELHQTSQQTHLLPCLAGGRVSATWAAVAGAARRVAGELWMKTRTPPSPPETHPARDVSNVGTERRDRRACPSRAWLCPDFVLDESKPQVASSVDFYF